MGITLKEKLAQLSAERRQRVEARAKALLDEKMSRLDRVLFWLNDKVFRRFTAKINTSPARNPALRQLLQSESPWEKTAHLRKAIQEGLDSGSAGELDVEDIKRQGRALLKKGRECGE